MCTNAITKFKFMLNDLYDLKVNHYLDDRERCRRQRPQYDRRVSTAITMAILRHPIKNAHTTQRRLLLNFYKMLETTWHQRRRGKHGNKHLRFNKTDTMMDL